MAAIHRAVCAASLACIALSTPEFVAAQPLDPVVLHATDVTTQAGLFSREPSASGASGYKMTTPDTGWENLSSPSPQPVHYFEASFDATGGTAYHLWLRMRGAGNSKWNESVWVQFDNGVAPDGSPQWRIGSASALLVNLEDCSACGLSDWGWQDNAWWLAEPGIVRFATTGRQRIRVQLREDGVDIDQIVLSTSTYATTAPGALRNDTTIVPHLAPASQSFLTRHPFLQQVTASSAIVVFATSRAGVASIRLVSPSGIARTIPALTTTVTADIAGGLPYYQHVARVSDLSAATTYTYEAQLDGVTLTSVVDRLTTAPVTGAGAVRFLAFGDSGVGSAAQRQLASRMTGEPIDFVLHTGDVAYGDATGIGAGTMPQLQHWFFDIYRDWLRRRPVYPSIGNHDEEAQHALPYRSAFVLPESATNPTYPDHLERYYSFDYGPAHVVVIDTELGFQDTARRQVQVDWLTRDLATTLQPWKIAVLHRSPYSAGGEHGSDLLVQSTLEPIFAASGVSLVLSGHEHDYERSLPQRQTAGSLGITYVVTGGGGAPLYPARIGPWTAASASVYHYVRGAIDACRLTFEAVRLDGVVFDRASLDRCTTTSRPYLGLAAPVPGTIEAEHFDEEGEGRAYHDLTATNEGGQLRVTGVDIEATGDIGGGFNVGWIFPGEWLTYSVSANTLSTFDVLARVSSPGQGGTFTLSVDDVPIPGTFQVPATGGWQHWQTIRGPRITLTPGLHRLRLDMRTAVLPGYAVGNLNSITLQLVP